MYIMRSTHKHTARRRENAWRGGRDAHPSTHHLERGIVLELIISVTLLWWLIISSRWTASLTTSCDVLTHLPHDTDVAHHTDTYDDDEIYRRCVT